MGAKCHGVWRASREPRSVRSITLRLKEKFMLLTPASPRAGPTRAASPGPGPRDLSDLSGGCADGCRRGRRSVARDVKEKGAHDCRDQAQQSEPI